MNFGIFAPFPLPKLFCVESNIVQSSRRRTTENCDCTI